MFYGDPMRCQSNKRNGEIISDVNETSCYFRLFVLRWQIKYYFSLDLFNKETVHKCDNNDRSWNTVHFLSRLFGLAQDSYTECLPVDSTSVSILHNIRCFLVSIENYESKSKTNGRKVFWCDSQVTLPIIIMKNSYPFKNSLGSESDMTRLFREGVRAGQYFIMIPC